MSLTSQALYRLAASPTLTYQHHQGTHYDLIKRCAVHISLIVGLTIGQIMAFSAYIHPTSPHSSAKAALPLIIRWFHKHRQIKLSEIAISESRLRPSSSATRRK